jgi:hypothetical protein
MAGRWSNHPSQLFTIRLWAEQIDAGHVEWRGKVQHVPTGEAHYFRSWQQLVERLVVILQAGENPTPSRWR